jgi:uncharacterized protein (DUF1330 family)
MSAVLITIGKIAAGGERALERYAAATIPLISEAGGEVLCRLRPSETVVGEGNDRPDLVAVIRFDSPEAIRAFLNSEEYRRQEPHRDQAFAAIHSYIAEDT